MNTSVKVSAIVIAAIVIISVSVVLWTNSEDEDESSHRRVGITILGEADLTEEHGVRSGDGTEGNPYVIDDWEISSAVFIQKTSSHIVLRNLSVSASTVVWKSQHDAVFGIQIADATNLTIEGCSIANVTSGILVDGCKAITVRNNTISSCYRGFAIGYYLLHETCVDVDLVDNEFRDCWTAVMMWGGNEVALKSNVIFGCDYGISLEGALDVSVEGNSFEYIDVVCVSAVTSGRVSVYENTMQRANGTGIWFWMCGWSNLTSNVIASYQYDIRVDNSREINISRNTLLDDYQSYHLVSYGPACTELSVTDSGNINFTENHVNTYFIGVEVLSSNNFVAHHNNIEHGEIYSNYGYVLAVDNRGSGNHWDDGTGEGNYWGNLYPSVDLDSDGIYDGPFVIDSDSQDNYPLVIAPVYTF